jgi:hypothetical protein
MFQLMLIFLIHFFFVQVTGRRLVQLIPIDRTCSNLKLSTAAPRGLLFFRGVTTVWVTITTSYCFRVAHTLESQCINLSWHGHELHACKGDRADLPIIRVILMAEVCSEVEC